jgi:hypothetical protein
MDVDRQRIVMASSPRHESVFKTKVYRRLLAAESLPFEFL